MLDVYADLNAVATELTAIRKLLERLVEYLAPLPPSDYEAGQLASTLADLHTIDDAADERAKSDRAALAVRFGVVPDSPAFEKAMAEYEQEMRRVHGSNATVDWDAAFREAWEAAQAQSSGYERQCAPRD